jgi:predicted O-methyltransferase YrrM
LAAGVRSLGGRVLSLERDHECIADWRRNIADAGLEETAELMEGDARDTLSMIDDVFDVVFLDAANKMYEELFGLARQARARGARDRRRRHAARGHVACLHGGAAGRSDPAQHDRST